MNSDAENTSFLHLGDEVLYLGALGQLQVHKHAAPVYLAGLYDDFRLRIEGGDWVECKTAVIPAGMRHELDSRESPLCAMYLAPHQAHISTLSKLVKSPIASNTCLSGKSGETLFFRELYENQQSHAWSESALKSLLNLPGEYKKNLNQIIDPRISSVLNLLHQNPNNGLSISQLAARQNLSYSGFLHLFSKQTGTTYMQYRLWCKLLLSMKKVATGDNLTNAALDSGFYDSQHFSHVFLKSFGLQPSNVLRRVSRANILLNQTTGMN